MRIEFAKAEYGFEEINAVERVFESGGMLASGPENEAFEKEFAEYCGKKYAICVNSGSSANLLALACLHLEPSAKVLTSACGFPATLSPILHCDLEPVLVDYDLSTHNIDVQEALRKIDEAGGRIKAVIFAHTLGNYCNLAEEIRRQYGKDIIIIEDCCEAIGTEGIVTNSDLATFSFYPAHQITAGGGGGMIVTDSERYFREMRSLRDWGKMYDWDSGQGGVKTKYKSYVGKIPYYKGYTYHNVGYNFKLPEMNCAFGREQLKKVSSITKRRNENFEYLRYRIMNAVDCFEELEYDVERKTSWFGFPMTFKNGLFSRDKFGNYLEDSGIRHRPFFAGNIVRHPPFQKLLKDYPNGFPVADKLMKDSLFVGCWPGLHRTELDYIADTVISYVKNNN